MDNNREKESEQNPIRGGGDLPPVFQAISWRKVDRYCQECGEVFEAYDLGALTRRYCNKCAEIKMVEEDEKLREAEAHLIEAQYRELVSMASIPKLWQGVTFESSDPKLRKAAFKIARRYAENFGAEAGALVFYSKGYGCGKTHLAVCIANHVLHRLRRPVLFKKARDLLLEIRRTFSERGDTELDILNRVLSVELLVLDDVGVDNPSPWIESTYWTIFDRRLEWQLPTVVTTNYLLEAEPGEVGLGERIGHGAVSRLTQLCQGNFIDMSGPDLR